MELIVACARTNIGDNTGTRIRALAQRTVRWPEVLRLASEHGIQPLLCRSLTSTCADVVPDEVFEELRDFAQTDAARNLLQNAELLRVLAGLQARGIPAIPFKGAVLEGWAYGEPSLRESGDLDIVVRSRHLREVLSFLRSEDYGPRETGPLGRYLRLERADGLVSLDLQTSLEAPHFSFSLDVDELWDRATSRTLDGEKVLSFCAEDLLVLLCVHGTKDVWFKLKWICDIAEFIDRNDALNWDEVLEHAIRLGARRRLLLGCALAQTLLGTRLPAEILRRLRKEPQVTTAAGTIIRRLHQRDRAVTNQERVALYFRTDDNADRVKRGVTYLRRTLAVMAVPSDKDRQVLTLPGWLSSAYYLVRPVRLIAEYGLRPYRALRASRNLLDSLD